MLYEPLYRSHFTFLAPDKGDGSGDAAGQEDSNAGGGEGNDANPNGGDNKGGDAPKFTQADLDRIVAERLERERRKAETKAKADREAAEAEALRQKEEWKTLAEKHEKRIKELEAAATDLETVTEKMTRYEAALKAQLDAARKELPAHILALLDRLDAAEQLEYLAKNAESLGKPKAKPIPETPKGAGDGELSEADRQKAQALTGSVYRGLF